MKIGISLGNTFRVPTRELVKTVAEIGFSSVAPSMPLDGADFDIAGIKKSADASEVSLSFLHAPFLHAAALWDDAGDKGEMGKNEILSDILLCEKYEIPTLVVHAWIGFDPYSGPTSLGFSRTDALVKEAEKRGIALAFENTEGEEYLFGLLERYKGEKHVGFCYDSGHEKCYNRDRDLLSLFGDRLLCTHLNDNLGISDKDGKTAPTDDLHLLPFDGCIQWEAVAKRLAKSRLPEVLNFELNLKSKPGRHENDAYEKMSYEEYFSEAYRRAVRIAQMIKG